jgi:hypothetical protein
MSPFNSCALSAGEKGWRSGVFIVGATPVGVGGVIVRLELNGLREVGDSAVECKRLEMRRPPRDVCGDIVGVGFDCLGVIRNGAVNLLDGAVNLLYGCGIATVRSTSIFHSPATMHRPHPSDDLPKVVIGPDDLAKRRHRSDDSLGALSPVA